MSTPRGEVARNTRGEGRRSSPRGESHGLGTSGRPTGGSCWSCDSNDRKENKFPMREVKATEDCRGEEGRRSLSGSGAASGSSRPAAVSGRVVRPWTGA